MKQTVPGECEISRPPEREVAVRRGQRSETGRERSTISRNMTNNLRQKSSRDTEPAHNPENGTQPEKRVPEATNRRIRNQTRKLLTRQRTQLRPKSHTDGIGDEPASQKAVILQKHKAKTTAVTDGHGSRPPRKDKADRREPEGKTQKTHRGIRNPGNDEPTQRDYRRKTTQKVHPKQKHVTPRMSTMVTIIQR